MNKQTAPASARSRRKEAIRALCVCAMLVALEVILERVFSLKTMGYKIGLYFIPPALAAMLYGPAASAAVFALGDLTGALLLPFGPYHPGFTVVAAIMGLVYGMFLHPAPLHVDARSPRHRVTLIWQRDKVRFFPHILLPVLINSLLLGLCVNTAWVSMLYGSRTYLGWLLYRLPEYAILVPVQLVVLPILLKLCDLLRRFGLAPALPPFDPIPTQAKT